jgi:hypothetical protein
MLSRHTTHPDRDPTKKTASLIWPQKVDTSAWWEEEDWQEYIQQHFSIKHIFQVLPHTLASVISGH